MAAEDRVDVHHSAPHCLLVLFDAAAGGLADWSEFDAEAARLSTEVRGLSREDLRALIEHCAGSLEGPGHCELPHRYNHGVRVHNRIGRRVVEEIIGRLPYLTGAQIGRLEDELRRELQRRRASSSSAGGGEGAPDIHEGTVPPVTVVLEYRPHEDGYLQLELRRYIRRDGSARERGRPHRP